jgi:outer membrane biosynthesis protein TonB
VESWGSAVAPSTVSVIVRIAWITAILIPVLIVVSDLFSGSDGGDSPQTLPDVASALPVGVEAPKKAQKTKTEAAQDDRSQRHHEQAPGGTRSAIQPGDAVEGVPVVTPGPKPPQAPEPKPPQAPEPKPPQTPPKIPAPSQPPVTESPPAPVQATITVANNNGPVGDP